MRATTLLVFFLFLLGCKQQKSTGIRHSFYYWKTAFPPADSLAGINVQPEIDNFYIHYFDVDHDYYRGKPAPRAELSGLRNAYAFVKNRYTPVVYITNQTFYGMGDEWCDSLAEKVNKKVVFITNRLEETVAEVAVKTGNAPLSIHGRPTEIQIDCDWTQQTRKQYFRFLLAFKKLNPDKIISVTIRLYPYHAADRMGVPPADRGMLMCYNLTNITNNKTTNSVFELNDLRQYLTNSNYPLPLDVALPVFGWYAWFSDNKFSGIVYSRENSDFVKNNMLFERIGNEFTALQDTMVSDHFIRKGDRLRLEYPAPDELEKAAVLLRQKVPAASTIAFYYWDKPLLQQYEKSISKIYDLF